MEVFDVFVPPLATAAAIATYASNIGDVLKFRRQQSTGSKSDVPYAFMLANALGWVLYGYLSGVTAIVVSNLVGFSISSVMAGGYVYYCRNRGPVLSHFGLAFAYGASLYLYSIVDPERAAFVVGSVASLMAVFMFASPLSTLRLVLETGSAESLPAGMVLMGLTCTTLWTAYGLRVGDLFMWGPNGLAMCLGLAQVALLWRFRGKQSEGIMPM